MYFQSWGSKENPVRQSDLNQIFGRFSCAKKFALNKIYPPKISRVTQEIVIGDVIHKIIEDRLIEVNNPDVKDFRAVDKALFDKYVDFYHRANKDIQFQLQEDEENKVEDILISLNNLFSSKQFLYISKRVVESERAFYLKIGNYFCAGTIDAIIKDSEGSYTIIDWKTGKKMSQFEMDHNYQSLIYTLAMHQGEFFHKPEKEYTGDEYYKSYNKWEGSRSKYDKIEKLRFVYVYLKDLLPAKRASVREPKYHSDEKLIDPTDKQVHIKTGDCRGPVFYDAHVDLTKDKSRIEYSIKCALMMAASGIFPECFSADCEKCPQLDHCRSLGDKELRDTHQQVLDLVEQCGIEPD
jgi:hypothetical protein